MLSSVAKSAYGIKSKYANTATSMVAKRSQARNKSFWAKVPMGPPDPILGVNVKFAADPAPLKLNLGVGAYRDDAGKPFILPSVREVRLLCTFCALSCPGSRRCTAENRFSKWTLVHSNDGRENFAQTELAALGLSLEPHDRGF